MGVSERTGRINSYDVSPLNVGWYSNWRFDAAPLGPEDVEYVQLVPTSPGLLRLDEAALLDAVRSRPGSLWIIGNEPERRALAKGSRVHDYASMSPQQYAIAYHKLHGLIKGADPTSQIAIGGVVQPSPVRLRWLDAVLEAYRALARAPMPVDVWNIHLQLMREKRDSPGCEDCWGADIPAGIEDVTEGLLLEIEDNVDLELMKDLVWAMRRWMKEKGQQDKPLIVSEYGVLMPSEYLGATAEEGDKVVEEYMLGSFDFFLEARDPALGHPQDENRLVQRWLWYSLNEVPYQFDESAGAWIGFNGSLFNWQVNEWPGEMTPLGEAFAAYTSALGE